MMDHRASRRYAQALLGLALERGELESVESELLKMRRLLEKHPEITHLVLNSTIALSEKEDFLDKILGQEVSVLVINFLKLLVKKGRFREFNAVQEAFHRYYEEKKGVQEVIALSPRELAEETQERLQKVLKQKLGADIRLTCRTDPGMIGGLIVRFADKEIDSSFRTRLEVLKQKLLASF